MVSAPASHIIERLHAAGVEPHVHEPTLYLSIPEHAEAAIGGLRVPARAAAFSASTGGAVVEGTLVLVVADENAHRGTLDGSIALVDGPVMPETVFMVERRGARAQIYIEPGETLPPRNASTIWGAPTHESVARKPRTPIVTIAARDAEPLRNGTRAGAHAEVVTRLREGWSPSELIVADVHGAHDPEEFILVHGTDDEALETLARDLHARRGELARSVRFAWWTDRAIGTTAASTWYADSFASEIDDWCVAHVRVGGEAEGDAFWMSEAAEVCLEAIAAAGHPPVKGRRPPRGGDDSFNQIGVTGLFGGRAFPVAVYQAALVKLATAPIYPFDYTAPVLEMGAAVQRYQAAAGAELNLGAVSQDLARLRRAIGAWRSDAETQLRRHPGDVELRRRHTLTERRLARVLVPLGFARGERFDHDPAVRFSTLPRLEGALHVAEAPEPTRSFLTTALVREVNKVRAAIRQALALVT